MAENKISFFSKEEIKCPICDTRFQKEELLTGRGRLISKDINPELRRIYEPNPKFGKIYPLAYTLLVCPNCWYAALPQDFGKIAPENVPLIKDLSTYRKELIRNLFQPLVVDFFNPRDLLSGTASYILAITCYSFFPAAFCPTFQRGLFSLRAAWLLGDVAVEYKNYQARFYKIQEIFYLKAKKYYNMTAALMTAGKERIETVWMGPDTDKNYGYDGFYYIINYLNFKMAYMEEDIMKKIEIYDKIKSNIGRIFGIGKASKEKPGPLLHIVRNLYDEVNAYLSEIQETTAVDLSS